MKSEENYFETPEKYAQTHSVRWNLSMAWLKPFVSKMEIRRVLEIGDETEFTSIFMEGYEDAVLRNADFDVRDRDEWEAVDDNQYDLILCMEVIEHLWDLHPEGTSLGRAGNYWGNGVLTCLEECHRVLRKGGIILITTPNLNSIASLASSLAMDSVYTWPVHPHELAFKDAVELVTRAGFTILRADTEDPYIHMKAEPDRAMRLRVHQMLSQFGFDLKRRGETTFILATK